MGWTAISNSFKTAVLQEYVDAINERMAVCGQAALDDLADGGDAASAPDLWGAWQNKVAANATAFLDAENFDGYTYITHFTIEIWLAVAGIPDGFRRISTSKTCLVSGVYDAEAGTTLITAAGGEPFKVEHVGCKLSVLSPAWPGDYAIAEFTSSTVITITGQCPCADNRFSVMPADWTDYDDPAYEHGTAQEGDVIGPWLLADLQAAINVLWLTVETASPAIGDGKPYRCGIGNDADRAAAIAKAQADYASHEFEAWGEPGEPKVLTFVQLLNGYTPIAERWRVWYQWTKRAPDIKCDADYYVKGWDPNGETQRWIAYWGGDFGYYAGRQHRWLQQSGIDGSGVKEAGEWFGIADCPPFAGSAGDGYVYGYDYVEGAVVCKWNVVGGFVYV